MAKRHTTEEIVRKLRAAEVALGEGKTMVQVCKQLKVSEQTYYRWLKEYGSMKLGDAKRLKELEQENAKLKKIIAELALDKEALKEVLKKKW
jgi:putative transposase